MGVDVEAREKNGEYVGAGAQERFVVEPVELGAVGHAYQIVKRIALFAADDIGGFFFLRHFSKFP